MPPHAVGKILLAGRLRANVPWSTLEAQLNIRKATREFWINGRVKRLPLEPILALAALLLIDGNEFMAAVARNEVPLWASRELDHFFREEG